MPISAHFTVEGTENPNEHLVAYGATVTLALVSIVGADVIAWEILAASEPGTELPAITVSGSPLGSTASFVMPADPGDDIGRSFRVKCTISSAHERDVETAVVGAANINGVLPLCPGEEFERHATHGWGPVINRLLATGGGGPVSLGGDVTGATSANTVVKIRSASVTVAGAVGTVLQVTGTNALGYGLVALTSLAQSGATPGHVPVWNGSAWATGSLPSSANQFQNVASLADMVALPVTALLDGTHCWVRELRRAFILETSGASPSAASDTYASATAGRIWMGITA